MCHILTNILVLIIAFCFGSLQVSATGIYPDDCANINSNNSGIYTIQPRGSENAFSVFCDMKLQNLKWTVIQSRINGKFIFFRNYKAYEEGFGNLASEHWLGLKHVHEITKHGVFELYVELTDFPKVRTNARYLPFSINAPSDGYRLNIGAYTGTAGDSLTDHNHLQFSTHDHDVDGSPDKNCALTETGAWWFNDCLTSHLNGVYTSGPTNRSGIGIIWESWKGLGYSLRSSRMLIRNVATTDVVYPEDCAGVDSDISGIYNIKPKGSNDVFSVFCEMRLRSTKWMVIQRRIDGRVNFTRGYQDYEQGFGKLDGEHWLGLQHIYDIIKDGTFELYVELKDFSDKMSFANYRKFSISSPDDGYRLNVEYSLGNAGDSLTGHNDLQFSTYDHDMDGLSDTNCALDWNGAWWFNTCFDSHLNGEYVQGGITSDAGLGIQWNTWRDNTYSLKSTRMLIRNIN